MVKPMKYGRQDSSQAKEEARLLVPATTPITGVMQQREANMEVAIPLPINFGVAIFRICF